MLRHIIVSALKRLSWLISLLCRQTVAAVDLRATLAGSFCYNCSKMLQEGCKTIR